MTTENDVPIEPLRLKKLDLAELTDEDVMERCAMGSEAAFRVLVQRYRTRIMNLVCRFINDRDRAEEISQATAPPPAEATAAAASRRGSRLTPPIVRSARMLTSTAPVTCEQTLATAAAAAP